MEFSSRDRALGRNPDDFVSFLVSLYLYVCCYQCYFLRLHIGFINSLSICSMPGSADAKLYSFHGFYCLCY